MIVQFPTNKCLLVVMPLHFGVDRVTPVSDVVVHLLRGPGEGRGLFVPFVDSRNGIVMSSQQARLRML